MVVSDDVWDYDRAALTAWLHILANALERKNKRRAHPRTPKFGCVSPTKSARPEPERALPVSSYPCSDEATTMNTDISVFRSGLRRPPSVPRQASSPEGGSDQVMQLLKAMSVDELRKISIAATKLKKEKMEDSKKARVCERVCVVARWL